MGPSGASDSRRFAATGLGSASWPWHRAQFALYCRQPSYSSAVSPLGPSGVLRLAGPAAVASANSTATGEARPGQPWLLNGRTARVQVSHRFSPSRTSRSPDLVHLEPEGAPAGIPFAGRPEHTVLDEQFLGIDGTIGLERHNEVRRDRGPGHILAMTSRAIQVELLPPVVHFLRHRVARGLVILVAQRRRRPRAVCGGRRGFGDGDAARSRSGLRGSRSSAARSAWSRFGRLGWPLARIAAGRSGRLAPRTVARCRRRLSGRNGAGARVGRGRRAARVGCRCRAVVSAGSGAGPPQPSAQGA